MKRARPKNKKEKLKKLKTEEKQERKIEKTLPDDQAKEKPAKKKVGKVLLTIFVILVLFLFVIMGFGLFDSNNILAPVENGKINVLLLGVDESGLRSDTVMVASYDANAAKVNLLSIPRDTKVRIVNRKITRKINEVHALSSKKNSGQIVGAEAMAEVVTQLTGIPINYYAEFSFASIDNLFDILGPVEFDVPDVEGGGHGMNYDDPVQNLHIHLKPGLQELSGNQIQQFLRYRKSNYGVGTGSDTDRVTRQQDLFKAVIDQKVNLSILPKVPAIFSQIS
ncbi:MAG: LCP family protein, partial [Clostridia bacterium]|nr:LCP family protein [Clostridia bacterium]